MSKKSNATKSNATVNFDDLLEVLATAPRNKNELTRQLNERGYIANMCARDKTDFTSVNNDLYYQLVDGSRFFFGTNRNTVQLWLTPQLYELRNEVIPNGEKLVYTACNDTARKYKTDKTIAFTNEWFTAFITAYNKYFAVRFTDIATATK